MKKNKFNLQFFAKKPDGDFIPEGTEDPKDKSNEPKITEEELKRRLAGQKKSIEARFKENLEDLKVEYEEKLRTAKMTKEEQKDYQNELKDKKIQELERKLLINDLNNKATIRLGKYGYTADEDLLDFVVREDEDKTFRAVDRFINLVEDKVNEQLKQKARQNTPTTGGTINQGSEHFDIAEFANQNRIIK